MAFDFISECEGVHSIKELLKGPIYYGDSKNLKNVDVMTYVFVT